MSVELFVYWHVLPDKQADAESAVQALQADLRAAHPGLVARLYRRRQGEHITVMEAYASPAGLGPAQRAAILEQAAHALRAWCDSPRHVECFEALAPAGHGAPAVRP